MSSPTPPSGLFDRNKRHQRRAFSTKEDVYWRYGRLLHEAESTQLSVERLLYVGRLALTFFTDVLRPSEDFEDVPVHFLGSHLLTFRDIESKNNGLGERVLVQEICSFDKEETPRERQYPGIQVAQFYVRISPEAYTTRENLLSMNALLKVELNGTAQINLARHGEEYTFDFPKLVFHEPLSEECAVSLRGKVEVKCPATGLSMVMVLSSDGGVKGSIRRLAGNGSVSIGVLYGRWDDQITVTNTEKGTQGILFTADEIKPSLSANINLSNIRGRCLHRMWTMLHDTLIYIDPAKTKSKAGERLCTALVNWMKNLMPDSVITTPPAIGNLDNQSDTDADSDSGHTDSRNIPPCVKEAHKEGKKAIYALECRLIALDHDDLRIASSYVPKTAAESLTSYWRKQANILSEQSV